MKTHHHTFIHRFQSGNTATVKLQVPSRGKTFPYRVYWAKAIVAADVSEYQRWQDYVGKVMSKLAGFRLEMQDAKPLVHRRATQTTVAR